MVINYRRSWLWDNNVSNFENRLRGHSLFLLARNCSQTLKHSFAVLMKLLFICVAVILLLKVFQFNMRVSQ